MVPSFEPYRHGPAMQPGAAGRPSPCNGTSAGHWSHGLPGSEDLQSCSPPKSPSCVPVRETGKHAEHIWKYIYIYCLVVDLPLWKIWKSVGMIIPNIGENKIHVPNHQSVYCLASYGPRMPCIDDLGNDGWYTVWTKVSSVERDNRSNRTGAGSCTQSFDEV